MAETTYTQNLIKHILNGSLNCEICRICLLPLGEFYEDLFTIVCKGNQEYCVADILQEVCNVQLSQSDQFKTCSNCFKAAIKAYNFYLQVQHNEEILNYYVNEITNQLAHIAYEDDEETLCIFVQNKSPMMEDFSDKNVSRRNMGLNNQITKNISSYLKHEDSLKIKHTNMKFQSTSTIMSEPRDKKLEERGRNLIELKVNKKYDDSLNIWKPIPKNKNEKKRKRKRNPMTYKMCSKCPVQYKFIGKLKEHMKTKHNIDLFMCKVCKAIIEDEQEFNIHLQTHKGLHICEICNAVFKKRKTIILHLKWHEKMHDMCQEGANICEICGVILMDESQLREHKERKHENKYTCYYCGRMYKVEASFERHIKKHELHMYGGLGKTKEKTKPKNSKQSFTCSQCGKVLLDERALLWHERLHAGARPYLCGECGRGFVSLGRRNQHALCAHTPPAKRCPLCPALFHLRSMVNTHIKKVHLKTHKRRIRESKHKHVRWKTEPVPIQELSVSVQNEILKMQTG